MRGRRGITRAALVGGLVLGAAGCGVDAEVAPRPLDTVTTAPRLPVPPVRQLPESPTTPCPTPAVPTPTPTPVPTTRAGGPDGEPCRPPSRPQRAVREGDPDGT